MTPWVKYKARKSQLTENNLLRSGAYFVVHKNTKIAVVEFSMLHLIFQL